MQENSQRSRFNMRTKRRKTNLILNSLIGLVLLLIIVVSVVIFSDTDKEVAKETSKTVETSDGQELASQENSETEEQEEATDTSEDNEEDPTEELAPEDESTAVITEGSTDPNVMKTIVNPNWKAIGTTQSGEHTAVYSGVDWDEMVKAISYATGLAEDNMTIQFLGNNGPNKSKGTVYSKDKSKIYRVSIEWVDQKGWKPTLVEELASVQ